MKLPKLWKMSTLGEHCEILTGFPFVSSQYTADSCNIRLLRGDNIAQGFVRWDDAKLWPKASFEGLERYHLQLGDLVLAMDRTWVKAGLKYAVIKNKDIPSLLVQRVARLRGGEHFLTAFAACLIGSHRFTQHVKGVQTETAVPHISTQQIKDFSIPVPPLPEQRKIADILTTWDEALEKLDALITAKDHRKKAIVQQLLTGKKRMKGFAGKWRQTTFGEFLQESRIIGTHGQIARKITVKLYGKGVFAKQERIAGSISTKYYVRRAGQFIYSKLDFLNGAFGIVPVALDGFESTQDLPAFDIAKNCDPHWLLAYVSRPEFYARQIGAAAGGRKARRVNPCEFLALSVRIPDKPEQTAIANILDTCDKELRLLRSQRTAIYQQKRSLMQKLLTGKLRIKAKGKELV